MNTQLNKKKIRILSMIGLTVVKSILNVFGGTVKYGVTISIIQMSGVRQIEKILQKKKFAFLTYELFTQPMFNVAG